MGLNLHPVECNDRGRVQSTLGEIIFGEMILLLTPHHPTTTKCFLFKYLSGIITSDQYSSQRVACLNDAAKE